MTSEPMGDSNVVLLYRSLLVTSKEMLVAVEKREWENFIQLELSQSALIKALQNSEEKKRIENAEEMRKIIAEILNLQAKIADLAVPWRDTIGAMIKSLDAARTVNSTADEIEPPRPSFK